MSIFLSGLESGFNWLCRSAKGAFMFNGYRIAVKNGDNDAFKGCGKVPLPMRAKLKELGYTGAF